MLQSLLAAEPTVYQVTIFILLLDSMSRTMDRVNKLSRNHTHRHFPFFGAGSPIIPVVSILFLIPDFIRSNLHTGSVHSSSLGGCQCRGMRDKIIGHRFMEAHALLLGTSTSIGRSKTGIVVYKRALQWWTGDRTNQRRYRWFFVFILIASNKTK